MQAQGLRLPPKVHSLPNVIIDRTTSQLPLATSDRNDDVMGRGYGLLEQWISRLGYTTQRAEGDDAFQGDAIVMICPSRPGSELFRRRLVDYVDRGGRLLVIDAGQSEALSTSNQILRPYGLSINYAENRKGDLMLTDAWPRLSVESAWEVVGGDRIATFNGTRPVCSKVRYGKGLVMAVGFGNLFSDKNMGYDWTHVPDTVERTRYDALFALLRNFVMDEPIAMPLGGIHLPDAKPTVPLDRPGPRGAMPQPKPSIK